jgi:hypothetical protein
MSKLYRQIDQNTFAAFDPSDGSYSLVPPEAVPPSLVEAARRVSPTNSEARADPAYRLRQVAVAGMLDVVERAIAEGDPSAAESTLQALVRVASDPGEWRGLRVPGLMLPVRGGTPVPPGTPPPVPSDFPDRDRALAVLERVLQAGLPSVPDLAELAAHAPALTVADCRKGRALTDAAWGIAKLRAVGTVDQLLQHAEQKAEALRLSHAPAKAVMLTPELRARGLYRRL